MVDLVGRPGGEESEGHQSGSAGDASGEVPVVGRCAVVAGGAGELGIDVARRLLAEGIEVHLVDQAAEVYEKANAIGATGHRCDVADETSVAGLGDFGPIRALVNAVGTWPMVPFEDLSLQVWEHVLRVNLTGTYMVTRHFLPGLRAGKGAVVNVTSAAALKGKPGFAAYAAAKAGVIGLTRVLARELGVHSIRVNAVAPGLLETTANRANLGQEVLDGAVEERALSQVATVDDVGGAIMFLLADSARLITGQTLVVDGGIVLQ